MPFCKICYDAGNSHYSTHNIKTFNFQKRHVEITCPYLKNITCTRCGKKEHTASYCKEDLTKIEKQKGSIEKSFYEHKIDIDKSSENKNKYKPIVVKDTSANKVCIAFSNVFSILCGDDDDNCSEINKSAKVHNEDLISYTADGEILGKVSDIIWGKGICTTMSSRWVDEVV